MVEVDGKKRVKAHYLYRNNPEETFKAANSNMKEAKARTDSLINKLVRQGNLDTFQAELQKKIDIGCLQEVPKDMEEELLSGPHHFCYLSMVSNMNSESTSVRMINDTHTNCQAGTGFSIENKVPTSGIGSSFDSLVDFRLYLFGTQVISPSAT